jgi:hypothetical protein
LVEVAAGSADVGAVRAWARVENAACARRLSAAADVLERHYAADGSADREQWIIDNFAAVAAEIAPTQGVSLGVAGHQLEIAIVLRDRLPKVNAVFMTGVITYRMVAAIEARTRLIGDPQAVAAVDAAIADHLTGWTGLSVDRLHAEIDYWVDRFDPAAVRRAGSSSRGRCVQVHDPKDGSGLASVEALVFAQDGEFIDARLEAMAAAVCDNDPRTLDQRRSDAMGAVFTGTLTLPCACGTADCPAAGAAPSTVVVHVVASEESLADDSPAQLDGHLTGEAARDARYATRRSPFSAYRISENIAEA